MERITGTLDFELNRDTAVAIGKFDGIHLGHQKLLEGILQKKKEGLAACVFTFDPSPGVFFARTDRKELTTPEEKRKYFEKMGVDILIEFPMNEESAGMPAKTFIEEILVKQMHIRYIAAGGDLSFGAKGTGNAALLKELSAVHGYEVKIIEKVQVKETMISSTLIRGFLEKGAMDTVERLLGRPYCISGKVVHGKALGRTIGMPTLNVLPSEIKLLPPCGVYYSRVRYRNKMYDAISNIGYKPTVSKERILGIETYLYDFDSEIYGAEIEVFLLAFKRPEMRFASLEELQVQTRKDLADGKKFHLSKND